MYGWRSITKPDINQNDGSMCIPLEHVYIMSNNKANNVTLSIALMCYHMDVFCLEYSLII